ncbi:MFS transporter-like protein [Thozetella sp. PMI_491]|nr:MFS transporter-like protein [Thozetella sp. PMI_491]
MGLGVLEDTKLEHVPGTSPLSEIGQGDIDLQGIDHSLLKHDASGKIVLVPQPSDSPNDPYNWPRWKKEMFTVAFAYGCGVTGALGPLLTSALVPLAIQFDVPLQTLALGLQGSCTGALAIGCLICNIVAAKIGKRPVYLISALGLVGSCFWGAVATSFGSLVAARTLQGFCMAPMEALVPASITDIWFVHERGFRSAIYNFGVLGGISLASPIAGSIIQYGSYRICLHAMGGASVINLILTVLFMPESAYRRPGTIDIDTKDKVVAVGEEEGEKGCTKRIEQSESFEPSGPNYNEKTTFLRSMLPYDGYQNPTPLWTTFLDPFQMISSPVVIWATLLLISYVWWLILISITLSQIFSEPPYNFSVSAVGAISMSSFVASAVGTLLSGPATDGVAKYMSRRNGGTFEPEFRLPVMAVYLLFTGAGGFAWGESLYRDEAWEVPVIIGIGLINFGVVLGITGTVAYVCDSHRKSAADAFGLINLVKNMFAFGLTFYANDWVTTKGVRSSFFLISGISIVLTLFTIPMYIWGKRARSFAARHRWTQF